MADWVDSYRFPGHIAWSDIITPAFDVMTRGPSLVEILEANSMKENSMPVDVVGDDDG